MIIGNIEIPKFMLTLAKFIFGHVGKTILNSKALHIYSSHFRKVVGVGRHPWVGGVLPLCTHQFRIAKIQF